MAIFDKLSGISADNGFKYQAKAPLDVRLVVDTYGELTELVQGNGAYVGMLVYVKDDAKYYSCASIAGTGTWVEFKSDGGTADTADKIKVATDSGAKYANITISQEEPSAGDIGDIWFKYKS